MTSKDVSENDKPLSKKEKTKNNLKGGDPSDSQNNEKVLMDQAFSSAEVAEFVEIIKKFLKYKMTFHKPLKNTKKNFVQDNRK